MPRLSKNALPLFFFAIVAFIAAMPAKASDNGLAKTPPMGWNSWNKFHCHVSDEMIRVNLGKSGETSVLEINIELEGAKPATFIPPRPSIGSTRPAAQPAKPG